MLTSQEISIKHGVSVRTAQRWIAKGYNEAVTKPSNETTATTTTINDTITTLIESQNNLLKAMLELIAEIRHDRLKGRGDNNTTQNDNIDASLNTSKNLALQDNIPNNLSSNTTQYDITTTSSDIHATGATTTEEKKEEKEKENFPLIYPPYKEKEKEERKELNPIVPFVAKNQKNKNEYSQEFEDFWKAYPKCENASKYVAYKSYIKASKDKNFSQEKLLLSVENYKKTKAVKSGFPKMASTFLNQKMYNEEHLTLKGVISYKSTEELKQQITQKKLDLWNEISRLEDLKTAGDHFITAHNFKNADDITNYQDALHQKIAELNELKQQHEQSTNVNG